MNTSMTYSSVSVWRVVIVEDDPEDMTEIRRLLLQGSDRRYQFVEAATGAAGVRAILDASNSPPDCVVLDYTLPDMDAMEVLAAVIGADGRTVCPVVVLTGTAGPEHGPAVLRAGAEDFISKSWMSAPSLTRAVDNAVERWAMTRELQAGKTALQVSETQLKLAVEVAGLGVNRIDYATNTVVLDTIAAALFGLQANVPLPRSAVHATFHPDDKDEIDRRMNQSLDPNADGTFSMEHRVIHPDGSVHWLCVKKQVLFSEVKGVRTPRSSVLAAVDVTGRKVAEADRMRLLQQAEGELARLADVFRHAPAFMCVLRGPDHVFELANDHYDQLVGHRQLLGRTVREAFPDIKGQGFIELLDNVYATGKPFIGSGFRLLFSQKPDRPPEERVVDFVYQASRDPSGAITGIVVVGIDVTDRKRAEEALRESQQFTRSVLENLFAFVGVMTADGTLTFANRAPVEAAGIPPSEVLGKKFWDCHWWNYSPEIQAQLQDACERAAGGEIVRYDVPVRMANDARVWIDFQVSPLRDTQGRITHIIPSAMDIAVRHAAEEKLRASEERLRAVNEALSEADRRKNEFVAMLAHELRNPLAPIRNTLQVLKAKGGDEDAVSTATQIIDRQVGQLVRLVDDLLDVSRVSRGTIELRKERVTLASVIRNAEEAARSMCDEMRHELSVTLPAQPLEVDGDPVRLIQIVSNLLTNACKFTDAGGRIWLTVERVKEYAKDGGKDASKNGSKNGASEQAVIRVRDNGIGISAENLPRLFQIFMQVDTSANRPSVGLGIGLALVKNLVDMHGGTVEVTSEGIGRGCEFVVRLPALSSEHKAQPPAPVLAKQAEIAADEKRSLRILVVDDNQDAANSMSMLLKFKGHTMHTVYDGLEAVEAASTFSPDVVLLDIGLPTLNGYEACRRIRENASGKSIRLIALTGWGHDEDRQKTKEAGFDAHMVKPVDYEELVKVLS